MMSTGYADVEDPHVALNAAAEERPGRQSIKEVMEDVGWKIKGVSWIYEEVTGNNLVQQVIMPLTGDFEKIDGNANAWDRIAKSLDAVRHNVHSGVEELSPHWDGGAAQSFERRIRAVWTVAIEADSQVARVIGNMFRSAADMCRSAAKVALGLLDKVASKLMEAAMTAWIPFVGWGRAVWLVYDVVELVDKILKIIRNVETFIQGIRGMINGLKGMGTALMKIKDVRDVNDFFDVVDAYQDGKEKFDNGRKATWDGTKGALKGTLGYLDHDDKAEKRWGNPKKATSGGAP